MAKRHLQHIRSSVLNKVPTANDLVYGEIAMNYAKGSETLYLKNSNDEIVPFTNGNKIAETEAEIEQALSDINERIDSIDVNYMTNVTYSQLVSLKQNAQLEPGMNYRITDYVTTTAQEDTQSAGHQFDIVVMALNESTLSENAHAVAHAGDTYFSKAKLSAWELKYSLENNTNDFAWADDTNGKGVIYYMKDEYMNECPYDFKNIMFKKYKVTAVNNSFLDDSEKTVSNAVIYANRNPYYVGCIDIQYYEGTPTNVSAPYNATLGDYDYFYTFTGIDITNINDYWELETDEERDQFVFTYAYYELSAGFKSTSNTVQSERKTTREIVYNNRIGMNPTTHYGDNNQKLRLPGNVFFGSPNGLRPALGVSVGWYDTPTRIASNIIHCDCMNNIFIGSSVENIMYETSHANIVGKNGTSNTFGNYSYNNILGENSFANRIDEYCHENNFGSECKYNAVGRNCYNNLLHYESVMNNIGDGVWDSNFCCSSVDVGDGCSDIAVKGYQISIGYNLRTCMIGDIANNLTVTYSTIGNWVHGLFVRDSSSIIVDNGCHNITLPDNSYDVHVLPAAYGVSDQNPYYVNENLSGNYLKYIGKNSNGDVVVWNPADHVLPNSATR